MDANRPADAPFPVPGTPPDASVPAGGPPAPPRSGGPDSTAALWPSAPPVGPSAPPSPGDAWTAGNTTAGNTTAGNTTARPADADDETELPPAGLWQKMKADPQYAPEHLALEAVHRLGPQALRWVEQTRSQYPGIDHATVAQIAARRFTTHARLSGAAAGATGLPGAVIDIGVLAWTQARMVLHIAAAYGVDPCDAERATELLVLQNVHKVTQTARTALAVARGHEQAGVLFASDKASVPMSRVFVQLGLKLAQMAGVRAAKKMFAKLVPGAAVILGSWANSSATKDLARRSVELYGGQRQFQLPQGPAPTA